MTTDISWIKQVLLQQYPRIAKDKGVDLDNNGEIEGDETFGDLNNDRKINDNDFWIYLDRNKNIISRQIDRIGWMGKNISSDNIINRLLLIESEVCTKDEMIKAYEKVNKFIAAVKKELGGKNIAPKEQLKITYNMLQKEFNIDFEVQKNSLFTKNLLNGAMDCDTTTFLFLAIGHELEWSLYPVSVPEHMYMRWQDKRDYFFFDYGEITAGFQYRIDFNIDTATADNGVYLENLSQDQAIGAFYHARGCAKFKSNDYKGAIKDYTRAIELYPKFVLAYLNRGNAKFNLKDYKGAIKDYTKAIDLDPNNIDAYRKRSNAKLKIKDNKGAESDKTKAMQIDIQQKSLRGY